MSRKQYTQYDWLNWEKEEAYCSRCKQWKPFSEFPPIKPKKGCQYTNSNRSVVNVNCKQCNKERAKEWRLKHPNYKGTGKIKNIPEELRPWASAVRSKIKDAKERSVKYSKAFNLTFDYCWNLLLQQNKKCALTGYDLSLEKGHPFNISLDAIDPTKGYIEGNIQWVLWCANRAKGDLNLPTFYDLCTLILQHRKEQRLSSNGVDSSESKRRTPNEN